MSSTRSDQQRFAESPSDAFNWVAQELDFPTPEAMDRLRRAFLAVFGDSHSKAVRALESCWPDGARWPEGEAYLRTLGWRSPSEFADDDEADAYNNAYKGPELMELLYQRLFHVTHRIYRDAQVRELIEPSLPTRLSKYTAVILNRDGLLTKRQDPCGIGPNKKMSIAEGLEVLRQPAHAHPACRCTVDPYRK